MALIWESWEADGKGQSRVASLRSDSPDYAPILSGEAWVAAQQQNPRVVLITRSRTDRQSTGEKLIWQRPGYVDPCHEELT